MHVLRPAISKQAILGCILAHKYLFFSLHKKWWLLAALSIISKKQVVESWSSSPCSSGRITSTWVIATSSCTWSSSSPCCIAYYSASPCCIACTSSSPSCIGTTSTTPCCISCTSSSSCCIASTCSSSHPAPGHGCCHPTYRDCVPSISNKARLRQGTKVHRCRVCKFFLPI